MATEYGYRVDELDNADWFPKWPREACEAYCKRTGFLLIAREVSEPRIVSIRA